MIENGSSAYIGAAHQSMLAAKGTLHAMVSLFSSYFVECSCKDDVGVKTLSRTGFDGGMAWVALLKMQIEDCDKLAEEKDLQYLNRLREMSDSCVDVIHTAALLRYIGRTNGSEEVEQALERLYNACDAFDAEVSSLSKEAQQLLEERC